MRPEELEELFSEQQSLKNQLQIMYASVNVRSTALTQLLIARQEQAVRRLEHQRRHSCERTQDQNSTAVSVALTCVFAE